MSKSESSNESAVSQSEEMESASSQDSSRSSSPPPASFDFIAEHNAAPTFAKALRAAKAAEVAGVRPVRIPAGSSGSYFVLNKKRKVVAVFKPHDEEPYGPRNPKFKKRVQRAITPCMFGRDPLPHNSGYLSEAGASLVDRFFNLNVVPQTNIVELASLAFNYTAKQKKKGQLPRKRGSFQLFVKDYESAADVIKRRDPMLDSVSFRLAFERLAVLDYLIRNTDRSAHNWLLRKQGDEVLLAAIDNGLAFPFKHPDSVRAYPLQWRRLPQAQRKFSRSLRRTLPELLKPERMEVLIGALKALFAEDPGFHRDVFDHQMSVLRGQAYNLRRALRDAASSPASLAAMPPMVVPSDGVAVAAHTKTMFANW